MNHLKRSKPAGGTARGNPWHAVSIVPGRVPCAAANAFRGRRFLSANAPHLPLLVCTRKDSCQCAYKHHDDRRGQPRRRDEMIGLRRNARVTQERRGKRGRRADD